MKKHQEPKQIVIEFRLKARSRIYENCELLGKL